MEHLSIFKNWVEKVIIGLNFCPFANSPYQKGLIRFDLILAEEPKTRIEELMKLIFELAHCDSNVISNRIVVLPNAENDFNDFLQFQGQLEDELLIEGLDQIVQIVAFHPEFRFAGTKKTDLENLVNSSPLPMLHILRSDEVSRAAKSTDYPEQVHDQNIAKIKSLSSEELRRYFPWVGHLK